jgi:hypothetical protein
LIFRRFRFYGTAPRRMMHTLHPILVLKNLFVKRDASKIPSGNYYCYDEKGTCPYWKSYQNRKRHGLSPFNGFAGCLYLNYYDFPLLNGLCKICGENEIYEEDVENET